LNERQKNNENVDEESQSLSEQFSNQISCVYSDTDCWVYSIEDEEDDVRIPADRQVWIDVPIVSAKTLIIDGTLEFLPDQDYVIKADNIIVRGRFNANIPCVNTLKIELNSVVGFNIRQILPNQFFFV
jgi:6-phosphogluconate dehydrogenase (decarboxylating)